MMMRFIIEGRIIFSYIRFFVCDEKFIFLKWSEVIIF